MASRDIAYLKDAEAKASRLIAEARDERKLKLREAQAEVKREIEAYRAEREARLRTQQPEAAALDAKVARATLETDRTIAALADEYKANKDAVLQTLLKVIMSVENPFAGKK